MQSFKNFKVIKQHGVSQLVGTIFLKRQHLPVASHRCSQCMGFVDLVSNPDPICPTEPSCLLGCESCLGRRRLGRAEREFV